MENVIIDERVLEILKNKDLAWRFIKHELVKRDMTLTSIAQKHNVHPRIVQKAKDQNYPAVENWISQELGLQPYELFPDRYDEYLLPVSKTEKVA